MTKFAVLVGCNYPNKEHIRPLRGCHNDVKKMKILLTARLGFEAGNIEVLTDELGSALVPTGANIRAALYCMAHNAKAGDVLFFYFSGHGSYQDITVGDLCAREECILPADCNALYSQDFQFICFDVPDGATFTILSDSCCSGGLIYTGKEQIGPGISPLVCLPFPNYDENRNVRLLPHRSLLQYFKSQTGIESSDIETYIMAMFEGDASHRFRGTQRENWTVDGGILISACESNQYAFEDVDEGNDCGAFTKVVAQCLISGNGASLTTNRELVETARNILDVQGPCLYCTDANVDGVFLGSDARNSTGWKCLKWFNFLQNMFNNLFAWGKSEAGH